MSTGSGRLDVIIIGAGAAGLAAARSLHDAGVRVAVLEARERLGGRLFTCRDAAVPVPIELGAEFIHGRAHDLKMLLREAGLSALEIEGQRWTTTGRRIRPLQDFWERLDGVMRRLPAKPVRDRSFQDFLDTHPGGRPLARDRQLAREFVEGFHAADPQAISARALADGGSPGDDERERRLARVVDGYGRVVEWLAAPLSGRIQTSTIVSAVRWQHGRVVVEARHPDGRVRPPMEARAGIVAVPVGVLKTAPPAPGAIAFLPALPSKQAALRSLAVGAVVRIALRLTQRFWEEEHDLLSFLHTQDEDFPVWWTAYPLRIPLMVGWAGGPRAGRLASLEREEVARRAVASLARQFGIPLRRLRPMVEGFWMHDWEHDPFARGAYSYQIVGGKSAPEALARPVKGTLFFAGEATDTEGATGTVHGAIASGRRAAKQVQRAIGAKR